MQVKKREALEKYGISLHSGPVSDPGLGPGGREARQPCPAASPPLEMSPQSPPIFLFHPSSGLAGTTSPPGRRDARQAPRRRPGMSGEGDGWSESDIDGTSPHFSPYS